MTDKADKKASSPGHYGNGLESYLGDTRFSVPLSGYQFFTEGLRKMIFFLILIIATYTVLWGCFIASKGAPHLELVITT